MSTEFQFFKMERVLEIGCTTVNVRTTTKQYTEKWLIWGVLLYVSHHK